MKREIKVSTVMTNQEFINVTKNMLPISCPLPNEGIWDKHPRVFLPLGPEKKEKVTCPYCSAVFIYVD